MKKGVQRVFKTKGEKALLAISILVIFFIGFAGVMGTGKEVNVQQSGIEEVVVKYFDRLPDDSNRIKAEELKTFIQLNKEKLYILDIRDEKDYNQSHVDGAVNVPFKKIGNVVRSLPKDKLIIVYCYSGQNGGQVVSLLNLAGYQAKSLSGGWSGWQSVSETPKVQPNSDTTPTETPTQTPAPESPSCG